MPELHAVSSANVIPLPGVNSEHSVLLPETHGYDGLPSGFELRPDGIWHERPTKEGDAESVWLCSPIRVTGVFRRQDGSGWGRLVEFEDPDGTTHRELIDEVTLAGNAAELLKPLLCKGLAAERGPKVKDGIAALLQAWRPAQKFLLADLLGWTDDSASAFALGDGRVMGDAAVLYRNASLELAEMVGARGTLEDWRREVAQPCVENPLAMLALCQALSGPLLQPLGLEGGGFHLHGNPACGKSTLLGVAASVWGTPSLVRSWRVTDNALEPMAAAANGTLLALDELYQIDPRKLGEALYMLGNGQGKTRMARGNHQAPVLRWRVAVLSSGETSIEDHMASAGRKVHAGQNIRVVGVAADARTHGAFDVLHGAENSRAFAERLAHAAAAHCGVAGPAFVKELLERPGHEKSKLEFIKGFSSRATMSHDLPEDPQLQRVLKRFAVAALAGELATQWQITGWPKGAAYNAMLALVRTWFEDQDRARQTEIEAVLDRTRGYLHAHAKTNLDELSVATRSCADGWQDADCFYLMPSVWKRIHGNGTEAVEAARLHYRAGVLKTQKDGLQYRMPRAVAGQPKVYAVHRRILDKP